MKQIKNKIKIMPKLKDFFLSNLTLAQGILLAPVVAVATTLSNALAVCIVFALITFFSVLISSFIGKGWPFVLRLIVHVLIASVLFIPSAMLAELIFPGSQERLGIYLPLLITNSMIVQIGDTNMERENKNELIKDILIVILGFSWVICLVGFLREFLSSGSIFGIPIVNCYLPAALYPFFGFILVGFLAAIIKFFRIRCGYKEEV